MSDPAPAAPRGLAWLRARLRDRPDTEHEQILIRLVIVTFMVLYMLATVPGNPTASPDIVREILLIYGLTLLVSASLIVHLLLKPGVSQARRLIGACIDAIGPNAAMYVGGEPAMLFYPFLLWSILGHGFRFGPYNLLVCAGLSVGLFGLLVIQQPAWRQLPILDIGLVLSLVILPAYFAVLLRQLRAAITRAEEANRAKSQFLATMSHELRTPLNAIIGMNDLMKLTPLDEEQRELTATARTAADALLLLVDDVLDLAKIEAGRLNVGLETFDLYGKLRGLQMMLLTQARAKGLYLRLRVDPDIPPDLEGGLKPLHQILVNLLANAIKFTAKGGVVLDARFVAEDEAGRVRLRFEVHDTGIGISDEAQARIFERFTQADQGTNRVYGGTGLGLSISRELALLLGGQIGVVSRPGRGSTFWLELPFTRRPTREAVVRGRLFVVGEAAARSKLRPGLEGLPVVLDEAPDAARLLQRLEGVAEPIAVAVVDADPPLDVKALNATLEARHPGETVPILSCRAGADEALSEVMTALGPTPGPDRLGRALHAAFVNRRAAADPRGDEGRLRAKHLGRILIAEDIPVNRRVITRVLEHAGHEVIAVETGEAAVERVIEERFDVVLLDLNLPGMSGFEVVKLLRFALNLTETPPLVALTADATPETRAKAMSIGFSSYVTKPIDAVSLVEALDGLLAAQGSVRPIQPKPRWPAPARRSPAETGPLDERKLASLKALDQNDGFFATVIEEFLQDAEGLISALKTAAGDGDPRAFRDAAHALKSSAAHLGAKHLYETCMAWRNLDDDALMLKAPSEVTRIQEAFEGAKTALRQYQNAPTN